MRKTIAITLYIILTLSLLMACEPSSEDMIPPDISGAKDITYRIGAPLPDFLEGVTARDRSDGDVTKSLVFDDSAVDYDTPGVYEATYTATDKDGFSMTKTVNIFVIERGSNIENEAPYIFNAVNYVFDIGEEAPQYLDNLIAYDPEDGIITSLLAFDDSAVDYDSEGVYDVIISIIDSDGNLTEETITVTVLAAVDIDTLNIYYINDVHGALLGGDGQIGFEAMGSVIIDEKETNPEETLFLAGGDILQGQVISNYFYGASTMDTLNVMGLDAFALGNHEFDWGLDVVTSFRDPQSDGFKADFPLLGANIFFKGTRTMPDFVDPYTIIHKGDVKVGIIGVMGYGLEGSIANSRVEAYEFTEPVAEVALHAEHLRTNEQVDVVLVMIHGADTSFNQAVGAMTGDQRVDAVFNGHSHQAYTTFISRAGTDMPVIQSGGNGSNLGFVQLDLDQDNNVIDYAAENLRTYNDSRMNTPHPDVTAALQPYLDQVQSLLDDVIIVAGQSVDKFTLTTYMAKVMRIASDADVAFHNSGGTRASISNGQNITVATLYQIFPFDNRIKTVELTGSVIKSLFNDSYYDFRDVRPGVVFEDHLYYTVATNDYVFDYPDGVFIHGRNIVDTGILIRDVLEQVLRNQAELYDTFLLSRPVVLQFGEHVLWVPGRKEIGIFSNI
ncbi:MAG: DUF5011 domain-containing protein [Acholeplasmataceae bacterium]|nr:DUF5011 domain-containing protein [Acholeplasmataceae bacterium]